MIESKGENGGGGDVEDAGMHVVKLRGLPFSTTTNQVLDFLSGVEVVGGANGVTLTETRPGRPSGECFVEVASEEDVRRALSKDKQHMGKRYIEVFASDAQELGWGRDATRAGGGSGLGTLPDNAAVIKLRGLPFGCNQDDILNFLDGLEVCSDGIDILYDRSGRSTGEAFVHLLDEENAARALHKDREKIGHRYIEVFASSADEARAWHARDVPGGGGSGYAGGGRMSSARAFPRHAPYDRPQRFLRPAPHYRNHDILQATAAGEHRHPVRQQQPTFWRGRRGVCMS